MSFHIERIITLVSATVDAHSLSSSGDQYFHYLEKFQTFFYRVGCRRSFYIGSQMNLASATAEHEMLLPPMSELNFWIKKIFIFLSLRRRPYPSAGKLFLHPQQRTPNPFSIRNDRRQIVSPSAMTACGTLSSFGGGLSSSDDLPLFSSTTAAIIPFFRR